MHDLWTKLGIEEKLTGEVALTKDPVTLGALEGAASNGLLNETDFRKARRSPHVDMDKITINQTMYLQLTDDANEPDADLAIVPLYFNL